MNHVALSPETTGSIGPHGLMLCIPENLVEKLEAAATDAWLKFDALIDMGLRNGKIHPSNRRLAREGGVPDWKAIR